MPRRLLATVAAATLTFGLVACTDDGDGPVTEPPPVIGANNNPSDGGGAEPSDGGSSRSSDEGGDDQIVAAPDIPAPDPADYAGMDEHTAEGAEQAFRYYIAVSMWAHQTGETELLNSLQTDDCSSCKEFNEGIDALKEHDEYWSAFTLSDVGTKLHDSDNFDHEIGYYFKTGPHTRPNGDFTGSIKVKELEYITVGGMTWLQGHWTVGGISAEWGDDVQG